MSRSNDLPMLSTLALMALSLFACLQVPSRQSNTPQKAPDIELTTTSPEALSAVQNGLEFMDLNNLPKAREALTEAIAKDPNLAMAYLFRASTAGSTQEFYDDMMTAAAHIEGANAVEKQLMAYGMSYLNNNWDERLVICLKLAQDHPDIARFQTMLGRTYLEGNQIENARAHFQKAIDLAPNWPGGYNLSLFSYLGNEPKDFKLAEARGLKLVELAPNSSAARIALGDCYRAQKDLVRARDAYAKAAELDPNDPVAYIKKGHADTYLGNMDAARSAFREAMSHSDSKMLPARFEAYTWLYAGDMQKGQEELLKMAANPEALGIPASQLASARSDCFDDATWVAFHQGQTAKLEELLPQLAAAFTAEMAQINAPEIKALQEAYVREKEALAAAQGGKFDVAGAKLEQAKTLLAPSKDPTKLNAYYFAAGYLNLQQKQYDTAIAQFEKGDMDWVYNKFWLAKACEAAGQKDRAFQLYREIADHNFNSIGYALIRKEVKQKLTPS